MGLHVKMAKYKYWTTLAIINRQEEIERAKLERQYTKKLRELEVKFIARRKKVK